jgi:hypothetical protein
MILFFDVFVYVSAFVAKLVIGEDCLLENVNTSPKSKDDENMASLLNDDMGPKVSAIEVDDRGTNDYACLRGICALYFTIADFRL